MVSEKTRSRLRRALVLALVLCVVLPAALFFFLQQQALELAAKNPWSHLEVGTKLRFGEIAPVGSAAPVVHFECTLLSRTRLEAKVRFDMFSPESETEKTVSLAEPEKRFDENTPTERVTTPSGDTVVTRRVETLSGDAHDTLWIVPEQPLFLKHTRRTREGEVTVWLLDPGAPARKR